jgi:signal transduction histidine kinase
LHDDKTLNEIDVGLGLIISNLIVSRFNGKVNFVSVPKEGSTFTFNFEFGVE